MSTETTGTDLAFHLDIAEWMDRAARVGIKPPTWARQITGPGQYRLFPLERRADILTDAAAVQVWAVPEHQWSPGDHVEIGPLPDGVRVVYEISQPYSQPLSPVAPAEVPW